MSETKAPLDRRGFLAGAALAGLGAGQAQAQAQMAPETAKLPPYVAWKDADALINRILLFDGHPNVQRLNAITVGENAEEMLRLALASEIAAVAQFNASAQECHDLGDHGTASVFEEMVRDEETHADWFESQLDAIERVGLQQYLAAHLAAGEGPEG